MQFVAQLYWLVAQAVAARALQKLSEDTHGLDRADHLRMKVPQLLCVDHLRLMMCTLQQTVADLLGVTHWDQPFRIMEELRRRARS